MKTRLFLIIMLYCSLAFSQNPTVGFISSSLATSTSIRIDYTINANSSNTTVVIKYGLSRSNLNNTFNCPAVTGNTNVGQFRIVSGNILSGTTYYYAIEATNSFGTTIADSVTSGGIAIPLQFTSTSPANLPVISNVFVAGLIDGGAIIGYTVNANGSATNTYVGCGSTSDTSETVSYGPTITGSSPVSSNLNVGYGTIFFDNLGATVYYKVYANSSIGSVVSAVGQFTLVYKPNFGSYSVSTGTSTSATINYELKPNGGNTTSVIKYGPSLGNYPNSVTGITASGTTSNFGSATINNLTPGATYYWIIEGTNQYGVNQTTGNVFTTSQFPIITNVSSSNVTTTSATINFSINPYSNFPSITPIIRYGTNANNLNLSQNCSAVDGIYTSNQLQNITGLTSGVTYYYRVEATNSLGIGGNLATPLQFTTIGTVTTLPTPIYNFEFNNNLASQDGSVSLGAPFPNAVTYVSNGTNPSSALQFNLDRNVTQLSLLPSGSASRSVHFRIKYAANALTSENYLFNYGAFNTAGQVFSFSQTATSAKFAGYGAAADYTVAVATNTGIWYEYILVYNGTSMSIYRDGVSLGSQNVTLNTAGDILRIGQGITGITNLKADLDYFRVFSQALSPLEVAFLSANPATLSSTNFNQNNLQVSLYPNPVNDILHIETAGEIKSVTVYGILGNQVLTGTSKEVNVSNLSKETYIVKIQDTNNAVSTKKFIKE